jgi:hypothetical protein
MDYASGRALEATVILATLVWHLKCFWRHPSNSNNRQFSERERERERERDRERGRSINMTKQKIVEQNIKRNAILLFIAFILGAFAKL